MASLGEAIKSIRIAANMTQEQLAKEIGATKAAISRYEANKRKPQFEQILKIARALKVSPHVFIDPYYITEGFDGERELYLPALSRESEAMLKLKGLPLKNETILLDHEGNYSEALTNLILGEGSDIDMCKPLLDAFLKLDFWGQQVLIEYANLMLKNPCFVREKISERNAHGND